MGKINAMQPTPPRVTKALEKIEKKYCSLLGEGPRPDGCEATPLSGNLLRLSRNCYGFGNSLEFSGLFEEVRGGQRSSQLVHGRCGGAGIRAGMALLSCYENGTNYGDSKKLYPNLTSGDYWPAMACCLA